MFCIFCKPSILICFSKPLPDPWLLAFIYRLDLMEFAESSNLAKMLIETNFHRLQKNLHIKWNVLPLHTLSLPLGGFIYPQTGSGGSISVAKLRQKCRSYQFSPGMRTLTSQMCWSVSEKSWLTFYWHRISLHGILLLSVGNVQKMPNKCNLSCVFLLHKTLCFHQNIMSKIENKLRTSIGISILRFILDKYKAHNR